VVGKSVTIIEMLVQIKSIFYNKKTFIKNKKLIEKITTTKKQLNY